jgi:hypothetical protein
MKPPKYEPPAFRPGVQHFTTAPEPAAVAVEPAAVAAEPDVVAETEAVVEAEDPRAWRMVDEATPRDGTLIECKDLPDDADASAFYARWRITRRRDHQARHWQIVGFWSDPITREPIAVAPTVWRMPEGYLLPGMVV